MDRTWTTVQDQYRMLVQWLSALLTKSFHEKAGVSQVCIFGATTLAEGMILVTKDAKIRECKLLQTLW